MTDIKKEIDEFCSELGNKFYSRMMDSISKAFYNSLRNTLVILTSGLVMGYVLRGCIEENMKTTPSKLEKTINAPLK